MNTATPNAYKFEDRLAEFLVALNAKHHDDYGTFHASTPGKRYVRIMKSHGSSRSAYAFVDTQTGDILLPASWKAPAKHARGNIFAADLGLSCCGPYGVSYLK